MFFLFSFFSCNDKNEVDEAWRDANIEAYNGVIQNSDYKELKT
jgi:hypothetical protein